MPVPGVDVHQATSTPPPPGPALLPGLDRWAPFEQGPVPEHLDDPTLTTASLEADGTTALLHVPGVGRYLARVDRPVVVEPAAGATRADVTCFLSGPVRAAQEVLTRRHPLHASTVSVAGRAVLVCGGAGAGKSAVAAALACRGHRLLGDAIGLVDLADDADGAGEPDEAGDDVDAHEAAVRRGAVALPTSDEVVVGPEVLRDLCLPPGAGRGTRPGLLARTVALGRPGRAAPLTHVVLLERSDEALPGRRTARTLLPPPKVASSLAPVRWHPELADGLLGAEAFSSWATALAGAVPFSTVRWSAGASLAETADAVEELAT
jgi:hypothetical protein